MTGTSLAAEVDAGAGNSPRSRAKASIPELIREGLRRWREAALEDYFAEQAAQDDEAPEPIPEE